MTLALTSNAFADGQAVPRHYTCDGSNVSPRLAWTDVPSGTQSLLLACVDPDAPGGTFYHWVAYNIPPEVTELEAGYRPGTPEARFAQAVNDFGRAGYGGPCPPRGHRAHGYHFRISALRERISNMTPHSTCSEVIEAAGPLEIASAEIVGYYGR